MADFPETTAEERDALRELKDHLGWKAFRRRLRYMQIDKLRSILDPAQKAEREGHEAELHLLRVIETLPEWMLLEKGRPLTREELKAIKFPPLEADLTEEHLDALD